MKIRLKQVIEAIEMADEAYTAFGDRQTRKPVFLDDPDITGMRNNELGALLNVEPERFILSNQYEIMNTHHGIPLSVRSMTFPGKATG